MTAAEKKVRETEVISKQAKQQGEEYMRLADKYNELEKRLEGRENEKKKDI